MIIVSVSFEYVAGVYFVGDVVEACVVAVCYYGV